MLYLLFSACLAIIFLDLHSKAKAVIGNDIFRRTHILHPFDKATDIQFVVGLKALEEVFEIEKRFEASSKIRSNIERVVRDKNMLAGAFLSSNCCPLVLEKSGSNANEV